MIGLDSNVLLRAITNDDVVQSPLARDFLSSLNSSNPAYINTVVLSEIAWTLRVRNKRTREEVLARLDALLRSDAYIIAERQAVNRAMLRCETHKLEFPDALIGEFNLAAGASGTFTFDEEASATPAFKKLAHGEY
ncbi:MAG: PIN domain-containing protein [Rhodomicrobium sp.]